MWFDQQIEVIPAVDVLGEGVDVPVVDTILHTMHLDEGHPKATGYEPAKVPTPI